MEKTKSLYAKKQQKDEEETVSEKETEKSQKKEESDSVSDLSDDSNHFGPEESYTGAEDGRKESAA